MRHDGPALAPRPIVIVGDSMLDRYWEGKVERISPEAPVPVLQVTRDFSRAGGAANVALNLVELGSTPTLLTLIGEDDAGRQLGALLEGKLTLHAIGGARHKTTQKIRCVALRHQLLRTDFEEQADDEVVELLMAACRELLPERAVVLLSDYAKGALRCARELIEDAQARGCLVLVDPKGRDFQRYRGADLLKPNEAEVREVVGDWRDEAGFRARCAKLRRALKLRHLLVTRGETGMTLFGPDGVHHKPAEVREVYDVSGAGDTVLATLAHCLAHGAAMEEAMHWANKAAGVVVGKFGTASVRPEEIGLPMEFEPCLPSSTATSTSTSRRSPSCAA
jgi:rfaE bifunctional protein kinase chain/domain